MANKESLATFRLALDLVKARGIASETRDRVERLVHVHSCQGGTAKWS
jgi:hypothetical protein